MSWHAVTMAVALAAILWLISCIPLCVDVDAIVCRMLMSA